MENFCPRGRCKCTLFFLYFWRLRMRQQIVEADSPVNRYYFGLTYKREPQNLEELLMYYIESKGAEDFEQREILYAFDPGI